MTTATPDSQFNLAMGGSAGVIESAATLADKGADYGNSTGGVNCTGPFSLGEWQSGESHHARAVRRLLGSGDSDGAVRRGRVRLHDRPQRARQRAEVRRGRRRWMIPADAVPQLTASDRGDMLFGLNTAVSQPRDLEPRRAARRRARAPGAADGAGSRGHRPEAAVKGYGEVTDALTTESVWVDADQATRDAAFDEPRRVSVRPRGGQEARRGGRGHRRGARPT